MEYISVVTNLVELHTFAKSVVEHMSISAPIHHAAVLTLSGDLGAGKTALVKEIGTILGVAETIVSPTFVVERQYEATHPVFSRLVHMDAYRIESLDELLPLHFDETIHTRAQLVCIEWPSCIPGAITIPHHQLHIAVTADEVRHITYRYEQA